MGKGGTWKAPGRYTEPAGEQLKAFGITTLPAVRVTMVDPPASERQRKFMGAELARRRRGEATETGMSETQLREFARKPKRRRK